MKDELTEEHCIHTTAMPGHHNLSKAKTTNTDITKTKITLNLLTLTSDHLETVLVDTLFSDYQEKNLPKSAVLEATLVLGFRFT